MRIHCVQDGGQADGAKLSIEETARKIASVFDAPLSLVQSHVVGWLEIIYEPEGPNAIQMEEFEQVIELWITPYDDPL